MVIQSSTQLAPQPFAARLQEDETIIRLVALHGAKQWTLVASHLKGRLGKQCRERWHNHLNPAIKHGQWTREEDEVIVRFHRAHGNQVDFCLGEACLRD